MKGSGHGPVYTVEARMSRGMPPDRVNGMNLDGEWRQVSLALVPEGYGVPSGITLNPIARENGYVSREAAMALAWWFIAGARWMGIEARVVEHEFSYSYAAERGTEGEPLSCFYGGIGNKTADVQAKEKSNG